jgi:tetratricopeptide (TPR) repeat protein
VSTQTSPALTQLNRLAQRCPETVPFLRAALRGRIETLWKNALDTAIETGDPIGLQLAKEIEDYGAPPDVVLRLQLVCDLPPYRASVPLREVARVTTEKVLAFVRDRSADGGEGVLNQRGRLANNLSVRLSALERSEEAVVASLEAVEVYRQLASWKPDAYRPDLAMSLNNFGNRLRTFGLPENALAAHRAAVDVDVRKRLAAQRPDDFSAGLAISLHSLGNDLSSLERYEGALTAFQEAVEIRRGLAALQPEAYRFQIAKRLFNLSNVLRQLGRREEALETLTEAVEIYREFADLRPDMFLPDLAKSLANLGFLLEGVGRREEGLNAMREAARLFRELALIRPEAFQPDLAGNLYNLGSALHKLERYDEALPMLLEAVNLNRGEASDEDLLA